MFHIFLKILKQFVKYLLKTKMKICLFFFCIKNITNLKSYNVFLTSAIQGYLYQQNFFKASQHFPTLYISVFIFFPFLRYIMDNLFLFCFILFLLLCKVFSLWRYLLIILFWSERFSNKIYVAICSLWCFYIKKSI